MNGRSSYTLEDLKAYKSLEAYAQFVCGWVRDVKHCSINNHNVLRACVSHSQRMNYPPLKAWIIAKPDGTISTAHCNCKAGLGEACSLVGALLFYVEAAVKIRATKTVTQEPASWMLPSSIKKVPYDTVSNINFQSAKHIKKKLDLP